MERIANMATASPNPPSKLTWIIEQNKRLSPLWDTVVKLGSALLALSIPLALALWTIFSGYLGHIGQAPLPATQASEWGFLLVFSFTAAWVFSLIALIPAFWRGAMIWNGLSPSGASSSREYLGVGVVTLAVITPLLLTNSPISMTLQFSAMLAAIFLGGIYGGLIAKRTGRKFLHWSLIHMGAAFTLMLWVVVMWGLLAPAIASATGGGFLAIAMLVATFAFLMCASFAHPALGMMVGIMVTGFWLVFQADPNSGVLIPRALYTANLGGGRPAHIAQADVLGEICNLGVDARPVLVFEQCGCEWSTAAARLRQLRGKSSLERKMLLRDWAEQSKDALRAGKAVAQDQNGQQKRADLAKTCRARP